MTNYYCIPKKYGIVRPMKTIEKLIPNEKTSHLSSLLSDPSSVLFFDIETTGLSPRGASIYLIGCAFYTVSGWVCRQYFAENSAQEHEILQAFVSFAGSFQSFWNFNGSTFDIPFIQARCKKHALPVFDPAQNMDMYRVIRPFKNILHLSGCRQKQLEEYIGLFREDQFSGGELIDLYRIYGENLDENLLQVLLLHNFEDIQGMLELSVIMSIPKLFSDFCFSILAASLQDYTDMRGQTKKEFQLTLDLSSAFPVPLVCHMENSEYGNFYFTCREKKALLKIPVFSGELKYFYKDYKNYSYLPEEDQAVHKSVAVYVDKSRRMPATAANCYTKSKADFIPIFKGLSLELPYFYPEHKSKLCYLNPDEAFLSDQSMLHAYVSSILKQFLK